MIGTTNYIHDEVGKLIWIKVLRAHWGRILQTQRFRLYSPATTTPPIADVLQSELEDEPFAASLTLVAAVAVGARLSAELREELERLVDSGRA